MIDLFMDCDTNKEFYLKMLISGLKNELQEALGTVEERKIKSQIEEAEKELVTLKEETKNDKRNEMELQYRRSSA